VTISITKPDLGLYRELLRSRTGIPSPAGKG
jgi:hypothetical protein